MIPKIEPQNIEKCAACGAENTEGFVVCSCFGAFSEAICLSCISEGREPYGQLVNYIAAAGPWPDGINKVYREEVKRQLRLHNKTEQEFILDLERAMEVDI